ncbi:hypothetical protein [Pseudomonas sp. MWU16-30323]|jgi:hypothetical protein|uniref:hypothetical protein n=1 Tax=Pseudomonas sp. MWU16-30323 TaxID=2878094 RepID=UPI001CF9D333|nr:hypothetical protein [Pseudomonas sp. MWU16-30323]
MTTDTIAGEKDIKASEGRLVATEAYEGPFDTRVVSYREWSTGTRLINLEGKEIINPQESRGIKIAFSNNFKTGVHKVPQDAFPVFAELTYFRDVGDRRTQFAANRGSFELVTYDREKASASGTFDFVAVVDGAEHSFKGHFSIRYVQE